jgi:chromosome segregation ATPase
MALPQFMVNAETAEALAPLVADLDTLSGQLDTLRRRIPTIKTRLQSISIELLSGDDTKKLQAERASLQTELQSIPESIGALVYRHILSEQKLMQAQLQAAEQAANTSDEALAELGHRTDVVLDDLDDIKRRKGEISQYSAAAHQPADMRAILAAGYEDRQAGRAQFDHQLKVAATPLGDLKREEQSLAIPAGRAKLVIQSIHVRVKAAYKVALDAPAGVWQRVAQNFAEQAREAAYSEAFGSYKSMVGR